MAREEPHDLEQLLERMGKAEAEDGKVSVDAILDSVGHRSFGAILLAAGIFTVVPGPADIPGVPTMVAVLVFLVAGQLILRHEHIWLPKWICRREIDEEKLDKATNKLSRPARFIDRLIRPRLMWLVTGAGAYALAFGCIIIALALPPMEFIPFSANLGGGALTAYALALIARDGVVGIIAHTITAAGVAVVVYNLI